MTGAGGVGNRPTLGETRVGAPNAGAGREGPGKRWGKSRAEARPLHNGDGNGNGRTEKQKSEERFFASLGMRGWW